MMDRTWGRWVAAAALSALGALGALCTQDARAEEVDIRHGVFAWEKESEASLMARAADAIKASALYDYVLTLDDTPTLTPDRALDGRLIVLIDGEQVLEASLRDLQDEAAVSDLVITLSTHPGADAPVQLRLGRLCMVKDSREGQLEKAREALQGSGLLEDLRALGLGPRVVAEPDTCDTFTLTLSGKEVARGDIIDLADQRKAIKSKLLGAITQ
jgi:hypothetical protein